jgi:hypothetical protein
LEAVESMLRDASADHDDAAEEDRLVANAKKLALLCLGAARRAYPDGLEQQQEILMHIADIIIETYVMESALLRARKLSVQGRETNAALFAAVLLRDAMSRIEFSARNILAATSDLAELRLSHRLAQCRQVNAVDLRRRIASRLLQAQRYVV